MIYILVSTLLMAGSSALMAQKPWHKSMGDEYGLPTEEVYEIAEDNKGYVWLGTGTGLYRFNGHTFTLVPYPALKAQSISGLKFDSDGALWCNSFNGGIYKVSGDTLTALQLPDGYKKGPRFSYYVSADNHIWVTAAEGIYEYNPSTLSWIKHNPFVQAHDNSAISFDIIADQEGSIWCSGTQSFACYRSGQWFSFKRQIPLSAGTTSGFYRIADKLFAYLAGNGNHQIIALSATGEQQQVPLSSVLAEKTIYGISADKAEQIWMLTSTGAIPVSPDLIQDNTRPVLMENQAVTDILHDRESSYWVSTLLAGIHHFPSLTIRQSDELNSGLSSGLIVALAADDRNGNIYIGHQNGNLDCYSPRLGRFRPIKTAEAKKIETIFVDHENDLLWVAQTDVFYTSLHAPGQWKPVYFFGGGKQIINLPDGAYGYCNYKQFSCFSTKNQVPEIATWAGFERDAAAGQRKINLYRQDVQRAHRALYDPTRNRLWVAYSNGLKYMMPTHNRFVTDPSSGKPINATQLCQTNDGTIWAFVLSKGIYGIKDTLVTTFFSNLDYLHTDNIFAINATGSTIWVATDLGIASYDITNRNWNYVNKFDGLPTHQINAITFQGDSVYLATNRGLVSMPLQYSYENVSPPRLYLSGMKINQRDTIIRSEYNLNWRANNLIFTFDVLAFKSLRRYKLEYCLLGLDGKWVSLAPGERTISFPGLSSGSYTLQVRAINEDGVSSLAPLEIRIDIRPPIWKRWWFIALIAAALSLLIYRAFQYQLRQIKRQGVLESELRSSKLSALKAQMNPHFIFNALNSIQEFVLLNDKKSANAYLSKFAGLMRLTLDHSNKDKIPLEEEVNLLRLYLDLEVMRFEGKIDVDFTVEPDLVAYGLYIPSMIIQPFIENAFKHGLLHKEKGELRLQVRIQKLPDNILQVIVEDNGVGRVKSNEIQASRTRKHGSFSTGAARTRLELLNQRLVRKIGLVIEDLYDPYGLAQGTRVILSIPYTNELS